MRLAIQAARRIVTTNSASTLAISRSSSDLENDATTAASGDGCATEITADSGGSIEGGLVGVQEKRGERLIAVIAIEAVQDRFMPWSGGAG